MVKVNLRKRELERTRQDILRVATELFMEKGFKGTSTREIAERCHITQPNLYHHFRNKKDLYLAVITQITDRVQSDLSKIILIEMPAEEKLAEMIGVLLDKHPTNLFLMLHDMFAEMAPEDHGELYQLFKKTYIQPFSVIFQQEQPTFVLRAGVSTEDAARFVLYNVSAILSIQNTYQRGTKESAVKQFVNLILYGIGENPTNH